MPRPTRSPKQSRGPCGPAAVVACGLLLLAVRPIAAGQGGGAPPYAPSTAIKGMTLDWSTFRSDATGADNFPTTWAGDGSVYTSWGDGPGFGSGGSKAEAYSSIGVARLSGSSAGTVRGENLIGGLSPTIAPCFPKLGGHVDKRGFGHARRGGCAGEGLHAKSYSILALDGELSMFVTPGSGTQGYQEARLYQAPIGTNSWRRAGWAFTKSGPERLLSPGFLQAGPDYRAGGDFVYAYAARYAPTDRHDLSIQKGRSGGEIALLRAPRDADLMHRSAWDFFAGLDGRGRPRWTSSASAIRPVAVDRNGVGWTTSAIYNESLGRYLLATQHGRHASSKMTLLEAPNPWGPWKTVAYKTLGDPNRRERRGFYYNFLPNSFSADGRRFTLAFTGRDTDSLLLVDGEFETGVAQAAAVQELGGRGRRQQLARAAGGMAAAPGGAAVGAMLADAFRLGRDVRARRERDAAAGLAQGGTAFAMAREGGLGLVAFPVGAAPPAEDEGAGGSDPTRAQFARAHAPDDAGGRDGGAGLSFALPDGTRLGVVLSDYGDATEDGVAAGPALASRGISLSLDRRLGGLELGTRLAYSLERYGWDGPAADGDVRVAFDGGATELSQRVGYALRRGGLTLTPWAELAYESRSIDGLTLKSAYLPDQAYAAADVGDTSAAFGLDAALAPVGLGRTAALALRAGVSYTRGLASDDYRLRAGSAGSAGAREETIERPEARTLGLALGGDLTLGEGLSLSTDLSAQHDPEAGSARTARVGLSLRF